MRRNLLLFLAIGLLISFGDFSSAFAQSKNTVRNPANDPIAKLDYQKKLRWTDNLFRQGSYYNAIEYYQQLLDENPRNPYLVYQLAECSWFMRDYIPAADYYRYAFALAPDLYPEAIYKEGVMLKMQGKYDAAIAVFNQFIDLHPKDYRDLKRIAQRDIEGCNMAKESIQNPVLAKINNLGPNVNSKYTELSPLPLGDTALLFSTMHSNEVVDRDAEKRSDYVARFMVSQKFPEDLVGGVVDTFQWSLPFNDGKFNDPKFHVGNGCFSPGGDRFFFTRCLEDEHHDMKCKIFMSKFKDRTWSEPQLMGNAINDDASSSTQPFAAMVGQEGRKKEVLFFSSNRTIQSRGGYDIWYAVYDPRQETYRRPQNAGKQINTVRDEMTPYYDAKQNKLYFASNGWVGLGGFDIYSADGGPSRYSNLRNLGYPINSPADDLYYIQDPVGKPDAYLVSNRIGSMALKNPTCCDDIWRVHYEPKILVKGTVVEATTGKKIDNAVVKRVDETGDVKTYKAEDGYFEFMAPVGHTFTLSGDKQGYLTRQNSTVSTADVLMTDPDDTITIKVYLQKFELDKEFRLDNILFDFDAASLRPESAASLDRLAGLMKNNPAIDIQIFAYTDGKGTDQYNRDLSIRRSQSIVNYLASQGISSSRMEAKGMGDSNPVAPNQINGKDNPEGRQENRRATFKISSDLPTKHLIFDSTLPGTIGQQAQALQVNDQLEIQSDPGLDNESNVGEPGSRVNPH